jgi:hypothetical protein
MRVIGRYFGMSPAYTNCQAAILGVADFALAFFEHGSAAVSPPNNSAIAAAT